MHDLVSQPYWSTPGNAKTEYLLGETFNDSKTITHAKQSYNSLNQSENKKPKTAKLFTRATTASSRPTYIKRPMTSYLNERNSNPTFNCEGSFDERRTTNLTVADFRESQEMAQFVKQDIKVFEKAKKVAKKNRYPNTNWLEHENFD